MLKLISFEFHLTEDRFSAEEFLFKILLNDEWTHISDAEQQVPLITTGDTPTSWSQLYFSNTCTVSAQRPTSVLWDRNLKQGSFAGKILWKPTQVCLLWYFHATDLARGGVKLVSRVTIHSKSLVAQFWVKSSPYLEIIDAFLLKNYPHPNFGNSFNVVPHKICASPYPEALAVNFCTYYSPLLYASLNNKD